VIVTARVHPGETPSSYVCQGFIEFIISDHPIARLLRDNIVFYIVPMLNPDGVFLGNQRFSFVFYFINKFISLDVHYLVLILIEFGMNHHIGHIQKSMELKHIL
jgi:hypothetical protein